MEKADKEQRPHIEMGKAEAKEEEEDCEEIIILNTDEGIFLQIWLTDRIYFNYKKSFLRHWLRKFKSNRHICIIKI